MDCDHVQEALIGYHFATEPPERRAAVDAHLLGCGACLRAYLALKRGIELEAGPPEAPSPAARARLRAAVAEAFRPSPLRRAARWLARPVPLYQGLAVALIVAVLAAFLPPLWRALPRASSPAAPAAVLDTSREAAESLSIY